jgi:hypothetical protein
VRQSKRIPYPRRALNQSLARDERAPNLVGLNARNAVLYFSSHFTLKARMKRARLEFMYPFARLPLSCSKSLFYRSLDARIDLIRASLFFVRRAPLIHMPKWHRRWVLFYVSTPNSYSFTTTCVIIKSTLFHFPEVRARVAKRCCLKEQRLY